MNALSHNIITNLHTIIYVNACLEYLAYLMLGCWTHSDLWGSMWLSISLFLCGSSDLFSYIMSYIMLFWMSLGIVMLLSRSISSQRTSIIFFSIMGLHVGKVTHVCIFSWLILKIYFLVVKEWLHLLYLIHFYSQEFSMQLQGVSISFFFYNSLSLSFFH